MESLSESDISYASRKSSAAGRAVSATAAAAAALQLKYDSSAASSTASGISRYRSESPDVPVILTEQQDRIPDDVGPFDYLPRRSRLSTERIR